MFQVFITLSLKFVFCNRAENAFFIYLALLLQKNDIRRPVRNVSGGIYSPIRISVDRLRKKTDFCKKVVCFAFDKKLSMG